MKDREVIKLFVIYLRNNGFPNIDIQRWPEDENRNNIEIDAIANGLAIEHTSIDTIDNQRRDSARFMQVVGDLELELKSKFPYYVRLIIPYEGIKKGQDWLKIKETFRNWLLENTDKLPESVVHMFENIQDIPFKFWVKKDKNRHHGLYLARTSPTDDSLPDRIKELFDRKAEKLHNYKNKSYTTILLVESDDIALMNEVYLITSICKAYKGKLPNCIDQIWYADTTIENELEFRELTEYVIKYFTEYLN